MAQNAVRDAIAQEKWYSYKMGLERWWVAQNCIYLKTLRFLLLHIEYGQHSIPAQFFPQLYPQYGYMPPPPSNVS